jgi:protoporphyrinogen oxidase
MRHKKTVAILGAGPSGLSLAWSLSKKNEYKTVLFEKLDKVGGLSKTITENGVTFDIGPHRLSTQIPEVIDRLKDLMGSDLILKKNLHGVYFKNVLYKYPPSLKDLFHWSTLKYSGFFGYSYLWARTKHVLSIVFGVKAEKSFDSVLKRFFGTNFYETVIFPMITKVWGTHDLHADFANIRFELPTFRRIIKKIFSSKFQVNKSSFYYPKKGFAQIWDKMCDEMKGKDVFFEMESKILGVSSESAQGPFEIEYVSEDGETKRLICDVLVSSISNNALIGYLSASKWAKPTSVLLDKFKSRNMRLCVIVVRGFEMEENVVIFPERKYPFNRISRMNNYLENPARNGETVLLVDVLCSPGDDYDDMDSKDFNTMVLDSILKLKWFCADQVVKTFDLKFDSAYPILSKERYLAQEEIDSFFEMSNIVLCGREASSDYNNAHNAIAKSLVLSKYLFGEISREKYRKSSVFIGHLPIQD